jgi:hypothetical protein
MGSLAVHFSLTASCPLIPVIYTIPASALAAPDLAFPVVDEGMVPLKGSILKVTFEFCFLSIPFFPILPVFFFLTFFSAFFFPPLNLLSGTKEEACASLFVP